MTLKEAFRNQNYLESLLNSAQLFLTCPNNVVTKTQQHLRSAVNAEAKDETVIVPKDMVFENPAITPQKVVDFLMDVFDEKVKLTTAISEAKSKAGIDIDAAIALNRTRQNINSQFKTLASIKAKEMLTTGRANKFDVDGRQVSYVYDIREVVTIDFNRDKVKSLAKGLKNKADEISAQIDLLNVSLEVDYTPKYEVGDSLEDCLDTFIL